MKKMRIWVAAFAATIILMPCMAQEPQEAKQISESIEIIDDSTNGKKKEPKKKSKEEEPVVEIINIENVVVEESEKENDIFQVVENMPEFPGGLQECMNWLQKNLKYPAIAAENSVQGRVIMQFIVNKDGSITDPKVVRSLDPSCDKEAIRLVKAMPKWKPGMQHGKTVRVKYTLPIMFRKVDKEDSQKPRQISESIEIIEDKTPQRRNAAYSSRGGKGSIKSAFEALGTPAKKVEVMPEFIGGEEAMLQFLTKQADYAEIEESAKAFGQQYIIKFIVGADGKLRDHAILRGIPTEVAEKALNIVKAMPDWKPGTVNGTPKDMLYAVALPFKVAKKEAATAPKKP